MVTFENFETLYLPNRFIGDAQTLRAIYLDTNIKRSQRISK